VAQRIAEFLFGPSEEVRAADERTRVAVEKLKGTPVARKVREQMTAEFESGDFDDVFRKPKRGAA